MNSDYSPLEKTEIDFFGTNIHVYKWVKERVLPRFVVDTEGMDIDPLYENNFWLGMAEVGSATADTMAEAAQSVLDARSSLGKAIEDMMYYRT